MSPEKQRLTFISYSRVNKDFALKLAKELRSAGFDIWLDQLDIPTGARWDDALEDALDACKIFMVILTPASISSENVKDEIGYAIDHGKRILPVLLEDTKIPLRLRRFQWVDFTSKSYEEGVEGAKQLLQNLVDTPTIQTSRSEMIAAKQKKDAQNEKPLAATQTAKEKAKKEELEAERKEAVRISTEKAEVERQEAARNTAKKAEAERKDAERLASEKAEQERKAKAAAAKPAKQPAIDATAQKSSIREILKNPKVMYGGIGIVIILFIVILASVLSGGGKTPTDPIPTATKEVEVPTQSIEPPATPEPTLAPPTATLPPTATPTFAPPVEPFVRILEITLDDTQNYVVDYENFGYTEVLPGMHIHFFFDTVSPDQAGSPGSGPWKIYGGPRPFTQYSVANRPAGALQMCALVANSNHSIQLDSGNCVDLP